MSQPRRRPRSIEQLSSLSPAQRELLDDDEDLVARLDPRDGWNLMAYWHEDGDATVAPEDPGLKAGMYVVSAGAAGCVSTVTALPAGGQTSVRLYWAASLLEDTDR